MSLPPYILGPSHWAQMMVQQQAQAQLAAVQAHAQAAAQAAHHAHLQAMQQGQVAVASSTTAPLLPQSLKQLEDISEDKLQEKGKIIIFI